MRVSLRVYKWEYGGTVSFKLSDTDNDNIAQNTFVWGADKKMFIAKGFSFNKHAGLAVDRSFSYVNGEKEAWFDYENVGDTPPDFVDEENMDYEEDLDDDYEENEEDR